VQLRLCCGLGHGGIVVAELKLEQPSDEEDTGESPFKTEARRPTPVAAWHNGGDIAIRLYAQSLQRAAETLIGKLDREGVIPTAAEPHRVAVGHSEVTLFVATWQ
jgi:hypothetical protein